MSKPTWKKITESLRADIDSGALKPGDRLPTDFGLAELWNVSRPTAHRALHELMRLGLVDRSRSAGTTVATPKSARTGRVALIFDHIAEAYDFPQADLLRGIQEGLGDTYNLLWCDSKGEPEREAEFLLRMQDEADGVICFPTADVHNQELLNILGRSSSPLVLLDRVPEGVSAYCVMSDNRDAARRAMASLTRRNHKQIGFLSFHKPHFSTVRDRFDAYLDAHREADLEISQAHVRWFSADLELSHDGRFHQAVQDAIFQMTKGAEPVSAVFCVQDQIAQAVIAAADAIGVEIPNQLEVATFNDWPPMMLGRPWDLHRVVPRTRMIGELAAALLIRIMDGLAPSERVVQVQADFFSADAGLVEPAAASSFESNYLKTKEGYKRNVTQI